MYLKFSGYRNRRPKAIELVEPLWPAVRELTSGTSHAIEFLVNYVSVLTGSFTIISIEASNWALRKQCTCCTMEQFTSHVLKHIHVVLIAQESYISIDERRLLSICLITVRACYAEALMLLPFVV
jgi:hypothetical protein